MSVTAASQNAADALCAKLSVTSMNAKLQQAGLPAASLHEAATTARSGDGGSTSDAAAGGGMLPAIISAAAGVVVLLVITFFFYLRYYKKMATSMSDLASAELGMHPQTAPTARPSDMEAHVDTAGVPAGNLCVYCGTTNEVSSEVCQHCRKLLRRKDVAGLLFEQVAQHVHMLYMYI